MTHATFTTYGQYYALGKNDMENKRPCSHPSSITEQHAYRGYMDGYGDSPYDEPRAAVIVHKPRLTIKE